MIWSGFLLFVLILLTLDLGVFNRRPRVIGLRAAVLWSLVWVALSLAFTVAIYDGYAHHRLGLGIVPDAVDGRVNDGASAAAKYLAGYLLEKSLSVDNLFVIAVIFRFIAVPAELQHRVLFWGVLGAMILRGVMIGLGVELISHHHWVLYLLSGFLLITGMRMLLAGDRPPDPARNLVLRIMRRFLPISDRFDGHKFTTIEQGRRILTPLALALVLIETADAAFATDSIPAIFGVTADPFLIFTSNILAVLGLRSLYFALSGLLDRFHLLKVSLAVILILVAVKIVAAHWLAPGAAYALTPYLLGVIAVLLAAGILASMLARSISSRNKKQGPHWHPAELGPSPRRAR
ncbi:MAG TPA: TerC/Alx family metal homeostasis membrane protein [Tepidisphaeraceae bacterium]|nr:TerC/Alx family metal homeostasis membrane protein [Tepidisphaeraceae bacterium]